MDVPLEFFRQLSEEDAADDADDVGGGYYDRYGSHDRNPGLRFPQPHENREFGDKAREARHAHRHQAADDESECHQRHDLPEAAQVRNLARMRLVVHHADDSKEES